MYTKSEQKQIDRAKIMGRGALLKTLAIMHRSGNTRLQKTIERDIEAGNCWEEFKIVNGALLHISEVLS